MFDLLLLPVSFIGGLVAYKCWEERTDKTFAPKKYEVPSHSPSRSSLAGVQIVDITSTNNSYDPIGDVLSELDLDEVQTILGEPLRADMEGYM